MNINIFGVGKSGTTALYVALQRIMRDQLEEAVKYYYEPFLRDPEFVGDLYETSESKFKYIDSLSSEGIYTHTKLPMLIREVGKYMDDPFINGIYGSSPSRNTLLIDRLASSREQDKMHRLVKYNRACGRYRLITSIAATSKPIFIIRNPLDVANSVKNKFSFYGGEFHRDDESRFLEEVNLSYQADYTSGDFENYVESQLFYWYYMNRFALESFRGLPKKPFIVSYESFFGNVEENLKKLCEYLGLFYKSEYLEYFSKPIGPVTRVKRMHKSELAVGGRYLEKYFALLEEHEVAHSLCGKELLGSFKVSGGVPTQRNQYYGLHGRAIGALVSASGLNPKLEVERKNLQVQEKPRFLHVLNPVVKKESSDLFNAQPITFDTMQSAKAYAASKGITVSQIAAFYKEDEVLVPKSFGKCRLLDRSCLDFQSFGTPRKLPLFQDIFERCAEFSDAEYVIYTNVDIALMPHFYVTAHKIMEKGYDAVTIFRRTLDSKYRSLEAIPEMYADLGEDHPGTDCFIVKKDLLDKLGLGKVIIGSRFCAFALRANLHAFARNMKEFPRLHMTFHIGDDRVWEEYDEYSDYNAHAVEKMFVALSARDDIVNPIELKKFSDNFEIRKARLRQLSEKGK